MKRALIAVLVCGAFCLGSVSGVGAAEPYGSSGLSVNDSTPVVGTEVQATMEGCDPNSPVDFTLDGADVDTVDANAVGTSIASIALDASFSDGSTHTVGAACADPTGALLEPTVDVVVSAASEATSDGEGTGSSTSGSGSGNESSSILPATGSDIVPFIAVGFGLVVLGLGAYVVTRRRARNA